MSTCLEYVVRVGSRKCVVTARTLTTLTNRVEPRFNGNTVCLRAAAYITYVYPWYLLCCAIIHKMRVVQLRRNKQKGRQAYEGLKVVDSNGKERQKRHLFHCRWLHYWLGMAKRIVKTGARILHGMEEPLQLSAKLVHSVWSTSIFCSAVWRWTTIHCGWR